MKIKTVRIRQPQVLRDDRLDVAVLETFGSPLEIAAICFIDAAVIVTVPPIAGFVEAASMLLTAVPPAISVRAVWLSTFTDVTPASTATRWNAGQLYRWS